jgi:diphthine synthase
LGELTFVGLGLSRESDISLRGLEKAKHADMVFLELYTSLMSEFSLQRLEGLVGKRVHLVSRRNLEEEEGKKILEEADKGRVVLLVPGDPLIATTHVDLRIRAQKMGIRSMVVHGASIVSAVIGLSGLQNYKFGRSVTIPFTDSGAVSQTPYKVIVENKKIRLHTLCFLDIRSEEKEYMTVKDALQTLFAIEKRKRQGAVTAKTLAVGIARAGSENPIVKADFARELTKFDFGKPPHSLVFPGRLHFMEAEALITLANAPVRVKEMID